METALSEYHENMRAALADPGTLGVYAYQDAQLDGAMRTVIQTGLGPRGAAVKVGDPAVLDPAPASLDARGYLVFQAALLLIGGQIPVGFRTRAMSVLVSPFERQATLDHLRRQIQKLEKNGDPHGTGGSSCFGIWQDMENALAPATTPERVA
jgi:hypothetical protein